MKDTLISFKTAKLAKEIGFNEQCLYAFSIWRENLRKTQNEESATEGIEIHVDCGYYGDTYPSVEYFYQSKQHTLRPTQSLLQKWLREKGYFCRIYFGAFNQYKGLKGIMYSFEYNFAHCANESWIQHSLLHDTYEEALESGLLNGLKWIKNNETK